MTVIRHRGMARRSEHRAGAGRQTLALALVMSMIAATVVGVIAPQPALAAVPTPPLNNAYPIPGYSCNHDFGGSHRGVDCIAPLGVPLVAVESGFIRYATPGGPYNCATRTGDRSGNRVSIRGNSGFRYYYGHLDTIRVATGQPVTKGQLIGTVGETGNASCSTPHLHFELAWADQEQSMDPWPWLGYWSSTRPDPWTSVVRADLNGNGNDELGFYRASDGLLFWYPMTSTGRLGTRLSAYRVARNWTEVLGADLDGNGRDELIFYRKGTGDFQVYRATTSGQLGTRLTSVNIWGGADVLASLNTDGDRDDELALYSASTGLFAVYEMTNTGGLGTRRTRITLGTNWREIIGINVNASSDDEIAFYNSVGTFAVYRTTAAGKPGSRLSVSTLARGWTELVGFELTGAGTDEIAFYQSVHGTFPIYRTTTSGKPGTRISLLDLAP